MGTDVSSRTSALQGITGQGRAAQRSPSPNPLVSSIARGADPWPPVGSDQAARAKSLRQIAAALNGRGIATARGGGWEAQSVANVLKRAADVSVARSK